MWQGFTIALREGIESFLIIALILSYLRRTGRRDLASAVYAGTVISIGTSVGAGLLFSRASSQVLWEGILAFAAAILVGTLLIYMKRVSGRLRQDIEARLEVRTSSTSRRRAFLGVLAFTVLMITREGMEAALLVSTALFQLKSSAVLGGLLLGLAAAAGIAVLWARLGKRVDIRSLLSVSALFLLIFLVQLVLYGIHELSEARLLPASEAVQSATEILGPDGPIGHLLAYALAVLPTLWLLGVWWKRRETLAETKS